MERNEGWLVKHFLKAEPTSGGFALVRGSEVKIVRWLSDRTCQTECSEMEWSVLRTNERNCLQQHGKWGGFADCSSTVLKTHCSSTILKTRRTDLYYL